MNKYELNAIEGDSVLSGDQVTAAIEAICCTTGQIFFYCTFPYTKCFVASGVSLDYRVAVTFFCFLEFLGPSLHIWPYCWSRFMTWTLMPITTVHEYADLRWEQGPVLHLPIDACVVENASRSGATPILRASQAWYYWGADLKVVEKTSLESSRLLLFGSGFCEEATELDNLC